MTGALIAPVFDSGTGNALARAIVRVPQVGWNAIEGASDLLPRASLHEVPSCS